MASIEIRTDQKGKTHYRVKVILKGFPTQTATFERLTDVRVNEIGAEGVAPLDETDPLKRENN